MPNHNLWLCKPEWLNRPYHLSWNSSDCSICKKSIKAKGFEKIMASIQDHLRTHLFSNGAEKLLQAFPQPSSLFNGVNYSYKEKVWNIRIAWDKDICDDIQGVFIRVHSQDSFYGYHFTCDKSKPNTINYSIISLKNPDAKSGSKRKDESVPFKFIKHLGSFSPAQEEFVPKLTGNLSLVVSFMKINKFFENAHHLLPELHNALEDIDLQVPHLDIPRQNDAEINLLWGVIPLLILLGGGAYVMVKIARYVKNQSGQRVLNS